MSSTSDLAVIDVPSSLTPSSLAVIEAISGKKNPIGITVQNVAQWSLLGWFCGIIGLFAAEQLDPTSQFTHIANEDFTPGLMGGAVVIVAINAFLAIRARKKMLEAEASVEPSKSSSINHAALWGQAIKDNLIAFVNPFIAGIAVLMNLMERIAPMIGNLASLVLRTIGGALFSCIEGLAVYQHFQAARAHSRHIKALEQTSFDNTEAVSAKQLLENTEAFPANSEPRKALEAGFMRMKSAGFDFEGTLLTQQQWVEQALIAHRFDRTSHRIKAFLHTLIGGAMAVAFAVCPPIAASAFMLGTALWVSVGTLGARLIAALVPERKWLNNKLRSPATVFEGTPTVNPVQLAGKGSSADSEPIN